LAQVCIQTANYFFWKGLDFCILHYLPRLERIEAIASKNFASKVDKVRSKILLQRIINLEAIASMNFISRIGFTNKISWFEFSLLFEKLDSSMLTKIYRLLSQFSAHLPQSNGRFLWTKEKKFTSVFYSHKSTQITFGCIFISERIFS